MAKLAMFFGVLLVALGVIFFIGTGSAHKTSLIPTWFGLALIVSGALANSENAKQRMLWMHIAVTVSLLGFIFPAARAIMTWLHGRSSATGLTVVQATAAKEELYMAILCLVFTALCVRSFIAARRQRLV